MSTDMLSGLESTIADALRPFLDAQAMRRSAYCQQLRSHPWGFEPITGLRALQRELDSDAEIWNALAPSEYRIR